MCVSFVLSYKKKGKSIHCFKAILTDVLKHHSFKTLNNTIKNKRQISCVIKFYIWLEYKSICCIKVYLVLLKFNIIVIDKDDDF